MCKPDDREIIALARREASIEHAPSFAPICRGFLINTFIVLGLILVAIIWLPLRILGRSLGNLVGSPTDDPE